MTGRSNSSSASATASSAAATTAATQQSADSIETLIARKLQLEEDLKAIEKQIFDLEESYLEETNHYGNVVKGWEGFLNSKHTKQPNTRKIKITDKERVFSQSSTTAPTQNDQEEEDDLYSDAGSTAPRGGGIGRLGRQSSSNKGYTDDDNDSTMSG